MPPDYEPFNDEEVQGISKLKKEHFPMLGRAACVAQENEALQYGPAVMAPKGRAKRPLLKWVVSGLADKASVQRGPKPQRGTTHERTLRYGS
eukprot:4244881-Amphidinium_carterae.1